MQILGIVKYAVSGAVGIGASKIVGKIIAAHVTPENLFDKITMAGGAWALGGIASKATKKHTDEAIDQVVEVVTKQVDSFKESNKLGKIDRKESTFEKEGLDPQEYITDPKTKCWVSRKTYARRQLARAKAGKLILRESEIDPKFITTNDKGEWILRPDEDGSETITLTKNAAGVWEEISVRGKK